MNATVHNRGSVLMEFVVVLPIYIVLFGGVFMWGDMAVHTTRLASADRTAAFDKQSQSGGLRYLGNTMFNRRQEVSDRGPQDDLQDGGGYWFADSKVDYPWSLRAAAKVRDDYLLPAGGTVGRLAFANRYFATSTGKFEWKRTHPGDINPIENEAGLKDLLSGLRVGMFAKNEDGGRTYTWNYYTLKRTKYDELTWRDNRRFASDLVAYPGNPHVWRTQVADEEWHGEFSDNDRNYHRTYLPDNRPVAVEYERYEPFKTWSE